MSSFSFQDRARVLKWIHIIQPIFFVAVIGLSAYRMSISTRPSRLDFWPLVVSIKSLVVLAYELLSDHFNRFNSLRAFYYLNIVETVFWTAALPISLMGLRSCSSTGCVVIGVIVLFATLLFIISIPVVIISRTFYKYRKQHGRHPLDDAGSSTSTHVQSSFSTYSHGGATKV